MNSLKSIASRITSVSGAVDALDGIGISVKDSANEMRNVDDILDDLGAKWKDLSAEQQQNIGIQVAGRYQLSRFLILMEQYDEALEATNTALNSSGSGYRENAEYLKSYEAQINMVKNAWVESIISMRDTGFGDALVLGLKTGLELFNLLTLIVDKIGVLPTLIGGGSVALALMSERFRNLAQSTTTSSVAFSKWTADKVRNFNTVSASAQKMEFDIKKATSSQAINISGDFSSIAKSAGGATVATAGLRASMLSLASVALPIAGFMALGAAISWVTGKISEQIQEQRDLERSVKETMDKNVAAVTTNRQEVEELSATYSKLSQERENANKAGSEWSNEKEQEYLSVQQELADIFPALVKEVDSKGQAHLLNAEAIEEEIARTKELANIEGTDRLYKEENAYKESMKNLAAFQDQVKLAEHQMTRYQEMADKARTDSAKETHLGKVAHYRAELAHYETLVQGIENTTKQEMKNLSNIFMQVNDITGKIAEDSQKIFDSIDTSSKSKSELAEIRKELDLFTQDRQRAFDTEDIDAFNKKTSELSKYLSEDLKIPKEDIDEYITYFNSLKLEIEEAEEKASRTAQAMKDLDIEMEDGAEQADEYSEMLGMVSEEFDKITDRISDVNGVLETYHENGELSNQQILDLIDKYPDLIQFIDDEARLIEELTNIRDNDVAAAEQQLVNKLMLNNDFYNNNLDLIQEFVAEQFKFYQGDLTQWQNLAQAKADVETKLINEISKKWGVYYNEISRQFDGLGDRFTPLQKALRDLNDPMSKLGMSPSQLKALDYASLRIAAANNELKNSADAWNSFTVDKINIDFKSLGTSADKAAGSVGKASKAKKDNTKATNDAQKAAEKYNQEIERSIYLADTYKRAIELLNLEMAKVNEAKDRAAKGSIEYQKQMEKELALLMKEKELIKERAAEINKQIKSGTVVKTGVVTTSTSGGYSGKYASQINKASQTYGIDPNIIAAVIQAESSFNPNARSHAGAQGLMQLMPGTARYLGVKDPFNIEQNIMGGTKYLAEQLKAFGGDLKMALAAYNAGPGNVRKYGGIPPFKETQNYVKKITEALGKTVNTSQSIGNSVADYYLSNKFRFTSGFGKRNTGIKGASTNHLGIDLAAPAGTDIKSLRNGKVVASYYHNNQGHVIRIQQDDGVVAQYQHMQGKSPIAVGQSVSAGQSIGKVGSTGRSSGNHLHLEITKNGAKVDPKKYLDEQGKAIATSTKETAEHAQDIDGLQSMLTQSSMDILAINQQIRDAQMEIVDTVSLRYGLLKENYDGLLQNSENRLKRLTVSSVAYRNELEKQRVSLQKKQQYNREEYDYYDKLIKSGTLNASVVQELTKRMHELGLEFNSLSFSVQDLNFRSLMSEMEAFSDKIADMDYDLQRSQAIMKLLEEGSADYRIEVESQLKILKQQRDEILLQRDTLQKLLLTQNLTVEQMEELRNKIQELSLEYLQTLGSIKDLDKALEESGDVAAGKIADNLINSYKRYLEEKRDMHLKSLDEEMKAEDDRHKKQMDNYKNELDSFRKIIQEKLSAIDKEESQRSYDREIEDLEKERLEVLEKINRLSLDDSYEAKAERKKLQEQLSSIDENISEKRHQREVELRKENLNEMMSDKEEQIRKEEELETERHEEEKDRIDKLKRYWEQFYTDQLNDERRFAQMKEDIVAGNFDALSKEFQDYIKEMQDTMPELENTLDGTMKAVGTSIRQNIIDELKEAIRLMKEFQSGQSVGGGGAGNSGGLGNDGSYGASLSEANMKVLAGKYINDVIASKEPNQIRSANIREKGHAIAAQGRAEGSDIREDMSYDSLFATLTDNQRKQLMEFIRKETPDLFITPEIKDELGQYGDTKPVTDADMKVIMGKFLVEKMAMPDVEPSQLRRATISERGRDLGKQGRAEGSELPQFQSYDDTVKNLDRSGLEKLGAYMNANGSDLFITDYLQDYIYREARKVQASAARAESGGYTGDFSGEKMAFLHQKELILNKTETSQFFKYAPVMEKLNNMFNAMKNNAKNIPIGQGAGDTDNSIHLDIVVEKMTGNKADVDNFANNLMESVRVRKGRK